MYPTRQASVADVEKYTFENPFPGVNPNKWPGYSAQIITYADTLEYGTEIMEYNFTTTKVSPELMLQIATLDKAITDFVPPAGGTEASRKQLMELHKANIETLKLRKSSEEQITRKHGKMVTTAGKIIQQMLNITSGRIRQTISMISADSSIEITMKPSHMMSQSRYQCYGQGSATAAADKIKRETERLPAANSVEAIRLNTEFIAAAIINTEAIKLEHSKYWNPIITRANEEMAQLNRELQELQQPPANLPDGQVFNVDQAAVLAKQAQINNKAQEQANLAQQSQYDSVQQLNDRDLGRALYNSIPVNSTDGNVIQIREAINRLVFDQTQVHPFSRYTHTVLTLHGQQNQRPQDNMVAATHPQHHSGYQNAGYTAFDHHMADQFDNAQAHAAYAIPPHQGRGGTHQAHQICHDYNTLAGCPLQQNCPRRHVQAHEHQSNSHNARRRQNYQGNQGGQSYYQGNQNQGNYQSNYQGNNNGGFQQNNDQGRGRSRSPGGRPLYDNNDQRQRQRTGPSPQREQVPPQNPPPQNPPPPVRCSSQSPNSGKYPCRGGSPYRSRDSSPG